MDPQRLSGKRRKFITPFTGTCLGKKGQTYKEKAENKQGWELQRRRTEG
jgi:hypothetical protein